MDNYGFDPGRSEIDRDGKAVVRCALCMERIVEGQEMSVERGKARHATAEGCVSRLHRKIASLKEANEKYGKRQQMRGAHIQKLLQDAHTLRKTNHLLKQLVYMNQTALHDAGLRAIYARDSNTFVSESHYDEEAWPVSPPSKK